MFFVIKQVGSGAKASDIHSGYPVRVPGGAANILNEIFCGFPQSLQSDSGIVLLIILDPSSIFLPIYY
jgi:hypothetical protein